MGISDRVLADKLADVEVWREARRHCITASEAYDCLTEAGRMRVVAQKRSGEFPDLSRVPAVAHGNAREPELARWAGVKFGATVDERLIHAEGEPRHAATPDMLTDRSVVELKTGNSLWGENPSRAKYVAQVNWQMYCTGLDQGIVVYEPHENYVPLSMWPVTVPVERDEQLIEQLIEGANLALAMLDTDLSVPEFDAEVDAIAAEITDWREQEAAAKTRKADAWGRLQKHLGERDSFQQTGNHRVTWTVEDKTKKRVDEAAARAADPELAAAWDALLAEHTTTETVAEGRLTVTTPKDKP